jgi:predicted nucleic acid-binding protein
MPDALLDTNAVSDLMADHPQLKSRVSSYPDRICTSVVVQGEIRYGLERLPTGKRRADLEARAQAALSAMDCEPISVVVAEKYGRLKASLEATGLNLQDNDLWIASTVLALGAILVTRDGIFRSIPGLLVEDWTV